MIYSLLNLGGSVVYCGDHGYEFVSTNLMYCILKGPVFVTCNFTVDDLVKEVQYNGNILPVEGHPGLYTENTISFTPRPDGLGEIRIVGEDTGDTAHCVKGGLVLLCQATDVTSPWHNFKSDLSTNWRAEDGSHLCSKLEEGGHKWGVEDTPFIKSLLDHGAKKIWTNAKSVTLVGSPGNKPLHLILKSCISGKKTHGLATLFSWECLCPVGTMAMNL